MSTRDTPWPQGTPCWVDLMTTDREAAWEFYKSVFGWEIVDTGADMGNYSLATVAGRNVAGLGGMPPGDSNPPPTWTTYLASDDIDKTARAVTANGGQFLVEPMDVPGAGKMAIAMDPTGAAFGLWQAGGHTGASLVNEPGGFVWNECMTRDPERARAFYGAVFGYTYSAMPGADDYSTIDGAGPGNTIGGMGALDASMPEHAPPHWMTYFQVADADDTVARVTAGGGVVRMGPSDTPVGRMAVLRDPQGAVFSIMQTIEAGESEADKA